MQATSKYQESDEKFQLTLKNKLSRLQFLSIYLKYTAPKILRILLFVNKEGRTGIIIDTHSIHFQSNQYRMELKKK
jgi:ATP-dependent RNA circularization protein (DNA/RNA ligase family)